MRVTEHWYRLPREAVEMFKNYIETVVGKQLWVSLLEQRVGPDSLTSRGPFPPQPSCDSVKMVMHTTDAF